ncbi:S-layer homology domain-containing protein [Orenia marismortui]|uniref:S-layer family protein n=1 Tax=Orenia marismortui TaxID=46469 RepID=A0A4R8H6T3_9FIRM|nr:S-layer homology domain-containing protein [Orenia marismortui]TDX53296.1 S-layer family protein [Orenia marismortui]
MKLKSKVINFILVFILLASSSLPALASTKIKDVPSNHWAYQSVKELVEKGYLSLYQDNQFKGENKVTRYELAKVIAKILNNIEQGQVVSEKGDVLTLKKLSTEFRSELVDIISQNEDLKEEIKKSAKEEKVIKEDLINTNYRINQLQEEVSKILNDLRRISKLESKLDSLEEENKVLKEKVTRLENNTGSQSEIEDLKRKMYWLGGGLAISLLLSLSN